MKIEKIITHDGLFHADEVLAIALIVSIYGDIPVERTRKISTEDMNNPNVWVIDVGGQYCPEKGQFDHHHDDTLDASCLLILDHLTSCNDVSSELYCELINQFQVVSSIDLSGPTHYNGWQVNSLIKSFNTFTTGFDMSVDLVKSYILHCMDTVNKIAESKAIWDAGKQISLFIRYCHEFPIHWKRYDDCGEMYIVYPNKDKYNVLSRDSITFPIFSTGKEEFLHNGRFLAVFASKEDAIACAQTSAYNVVG